VIPDTDYHRVVAQEVTKKAADGETLAIDDSVTRLRLWGGDAVFDLPPPPTNEWLIGAAADCDLRLEDPSGCVSRHHARLVREGGAWTLRDLGSTNGIRQDGERRLSFQVTPGVEIEIGGAMLVAESDKLAALRAMLARIIGWSATKRADVDRALRAVRDMATLRAALVLCGAGDLTSTALQLHRLAVGHDRPFVVADGVAALEQGYRGTLCVLATRLPKDYPSIVRALLAPGGRTRLVICSPSRDDASEAVALLARTTVVEIPPLTTRDGELERLIADYSADAVSALDARGNGFREHELTWLRELELTTLGEIEEVMYRLVALRNWGVTAGAQRLGISHVALSRWARRRKLPT
jgi:hypothetical protein